MNDTRIANKGATRNRNHRAVKLAPMAHAVRSALAVSAMAFALGAPGAALAAGPKIQVGHVLQAGHAAIDVAPVFDLTAVVGVLTALPPIDVTQAGDISIDNADAIDVIDTYAATAIRGYSVDGNVDITNQASGELFAGSVYDNAIGIYGYALSGDVSIDNAGDIAALSLYGLADGIFGSGANVDVANSGGIEAVGYTWATGIEARATDTASVHNSGDIDASIDSIGGAYGIYAAGHDVTVVNDGGIAADGYYATGIRTQSYGDAQVTNNASINAGTLAGSALAWGINAQATGDGAAVEVENVGDINAAAVYGAIGIQAVASGYGGTVHVDNSGNIAAQQNLPITSYGAYGILASADGDASIYNSGDIAAMSKGPSFGLVSSSFAGDASVTNTGEVLASSALNSSANPSIGATGIVAFSGNGSASVDNGGYVHVTGVRSSTGIYAGAGADGSVSVSNSGDIVAMTALASSARANGIKVGSGAGGIEIENSGSIYASGALLAFGTYSSSVSGDTHIHNADGGDIEFYSYAGRGFGMFAFSEQGDVGIDNAGDIHGYAWQQAYGARVRDLYGSATIDNSGNIDVESGGSKAFGLLMSATYAGDASITNSGDISAVAASSAYGVRAYGYGDAHVGNSGSIYALGAGSAAVGMMVGAGTGDATATNTGGSIEVKAAGVGFGILAYANEGDVIIDNASEISAVGVNSRAAGIYSTAAGDVTVSNSAGIYAASMGDAFGIYGYTEAGNVAIDNSGGLDVTSVYGLADGIFASGADVEVTNSGAMSVAGYSWAAGVEAQGIQTSVQNDGDIYAVAVDGGAHAFALYATGDQVVAVGNTGDIEAQGYYATGIEARSYGDVSVDNSGAIVAGYATEDGSFYSALATGINATSGGAGATVDIDSSGDISAVGFYGANGISAASSGEGGTVSVNSSGDINVLQGTKYGYGAYGIIASGDGDASVTTSGAITAYSAGGATGAAALSFAGNASVVNSGDVEATSSATGYYGATGLLAFGANGSASVENAGSVSATAAGLLYSQARAVDAQALGDVMVKNTGSLYANGEKYAFGVYAVSGTGDLSVNNAGGDIGFYSYSGRGWGVFGYATQGDAHISSSGNIEGYAYGQSVGVFAVAGQGDVAASNSGDISVASGSDAAIGIFGRADYGTASVTNSGDIEAASGYLAYGVLARGNDAVVTNSGDISAEGYAASVGVIASGVESSTVNNSGTIHAANGGFNAGVLFGNTGVNTLNNTGSGVIGASGAEGYAFAVVGGGMGDTINNGARILGAVSMYGGADVFNNKAGGVWDVGDTRSTDFGDGDDAINNQAGGTIRLAGGALYLGSAASAGNSFVNAGTIKVVGDGNLIDMGSGIALVPSLNPLPLVNDGIIDFVDGGTDDALTIEGDLGGSGAINIDMDLANQASDQLYVNGSIASGTVQKVNVSITQMPGTASTEAVEFAHVAGTSSAGAFVGGSVVGYSPSNFLDLGVHTSRVAGSGDSASFLVSLDVLGLNDTGALAAATASGAATFMNAQVGTFRQRLGVNPYGDAGKVMNAFVRFYSSEGDVDLAHTAGNFGQGGNFGFSQKTWGKEFGINANFSDTLHAGLVLGNADSRQRLSEGVGENRMNGATVGAYATWQVPEGFYVDLTGRWMAADVRATSAAGVMAGRVHTQATSLEAGYEWKIGAVNVVPQAQYTRTKVDGITLFHGEMADFEAHGGTFSQGRIGVEINKTLQSGDLRWTPYGALSAVREFDGKTTYTVADNFFGSTNSKGTSAMAELGLSLQKGAFGFGLGVNWTDGGAYKSVVGGQANVRFSW
jgi:outer membrane autotransporter protein